MRVKVIIDLICEDIAKLDEIGLSGAASHGYSQNFSFCLDKAIREFIQKYEKEL